ncbi:outer membrane beta-barrel protein [Nitrospira sp. KM1]|uniref:outer membrane beta-barrel protein n=1 Tax=Nitrospira sp. KM1 TaxID=1936990 RepID=UPI001563AF24|nr:outer membrane beta-barrel protein [Nitrospira sp. KM1]
MKASDHDEPWANPATARTTEGPPSESTHSRWHYGAYLDLSYPIDFNYPENHRWRSKATTQRVNELTPNMIMGYVRKDADESSPWGMEFGVQGGYDVTGQVPNASLRNGQPYSGADTFSHFSRANVSYLAPVGNGLKLTAGLFNSYIGYESFYAKDNYNYTRSYLPDYSPYFMFGVSAEYQMSQSVKSAFYIINRFNYLSNPNDLPSYGIQLAWTVSPSVTAVQNFYYGPDQSNSDLRYWRFFSDSSIQWKRDRLTVALVYDIGTERVIPEAGGARVFWTGTAIYTHWQFTRAWALAVRPELYYDPSGTMTGARQFLKAITTTLEYKLPIAASMTRLRMEYRYDDSTGPQSGFFRGAETNPGGTGLVQAQHLLIAAILWNYDSP